MATHNEREDRCSSEQGIGIARGQEETENCAGRKQKRVPDRSKRDAVDHGAADHYACEFHAVSPHFHRIVEEHRKQRRDQTAQQSERKAAIVAPADQRERGSTCEEE